MTWSMSSSPSATGWMMQWSAKKEKTKAMEAEEEAPLDWVALKVKM